MQLNFFLITNQLNSDMEQDENKTPANGMYTKKKREHCTSAEN